MELDTFTRPLRFTAHVYVCIFLHTTACWQTAHSSANLNSNIFKRLHWKFHRCHRFFFLKRPRPARSRLYTVLMSDRFHPYRFVTEFQWKRGRFTRKFFTLMYTRACDNYCFFFLSFYIPYRLPQAHYSRSIIICIYPHYRNYILFICINYNILLWYIRVHIGNDRDSW